MKLEKWLNKFGWLIVMAAALSISGWSLFYIGIRWGLPAPLAALVSATDDGGAIVCATLALAYARSHGDSGFSPRAGVFILGGISAYINMQHASLAGEHSLGAKLLYMCPPVIAVSVFELQTRWLRRGALRRAGRIAPALPVVGKWAWLLFPARTLGMIRRVTAYRLEQIETGATAPWNPRNSSRGVSQTPREPLASGTETPRELRIVGPAGELTQGQDMPYEPPPARTLRAWGRERGFSVPERGPIPRDIVTAYQTETTREITIRETRRESGPGEPETQGLSFGAGRAVSDTRGLSFPAARGITEPVPETPKTVPGEYAGKDEIE